MEGTNSGNRRGISPRIIHRILQLLSLKQQQFGSSFDFAIEIGMLEIYNEEVIDLLAPRNESFLEIRYDDSDSMTLPNLTKEAVHSADDISNLLQRGSAKRATATSLNEHCSRSHMIWLDRIKIKA
eukprot:7833805-Ditylum_brightwellii.AAC.1